MLNSPDSASSIPNTSEVLLFWDHALDNDGDPLQYELYFGDDLATLNLVDVVNDNYYNMQDLEEGTYYWNVNASDDLGGNTASTTWMFSIVSATNNAPLAFSVLAPSNGEEVESLIADLQWESTSDFDLGDEVTYEVQLGTNVGSISTVYSGQDTVFSTDTLVDNTTYYWRVLANDLNGASTENNNGIQSFRINSLNDVPGDFALLFPEDGSMVTDLTPTLMWEEPGDADDAVASMGGQLSPFNLSTSYQMGTRGSAMHFGSGTGRNASNSRSITSYDLYISLDSLLTDADSILVETNSYTPETELLEDVVYYWKVVATDDDGGQTESAVHSFWTNNMNSSPTAFVLESPEQDEETGLLPTFSWTASTDSDLYDELSYTLGYGVSVSSLTEVVTDSLNITPEDSLLDNTVYYWQVTAEDLSGATYTTAIQSFMVNSANDVPGDFALLFPEDGSMVTDLTPTLMWEEPGDADDAVASMGGQSSPFNLSTSYQMGTRGSAMHFGSGTGRNASNSRSITSYDLYISLDSLLTDADSILVETNSYTPETELLEDVVYYWKVVATDDDGGQTESAVHSFWTNNMNSSPTAFVLESPEQDEETGLLPTFSWTASTDSDLYDELSYTLGYGVSVSSLTEVVTDSLNITPEDSLLDNTVYYWQVTAEDLSGATYTTAIQSFMVNSANDVPGDFALLFPEDESMVTDLTPTLMWEEPGDADDAVASMGGQSSPFNLSTSYQMGTRGSAMHFGSGTGRNASNSRSITSYDVYISLIFYLQISSPILVDSNSYTIDTNLVEDVEYYWKVVATDDDGGQTESAVHSFWTNNQNSPPGEITLLTPEMKVQLEQGLFLVGLSLVTMI